MAKESRVDKLVEHAWNLESDEHINALEELEDMARCWEKFLNLPHEATISHGCADITRDWIASWNINPPKSDGFFKTPEEAIEYLYDNR